MYWYRVLIAPYLPSLHSNYQQCINSGTQHCKRLFMSQSRVHTACYQSWRVRCYQSQEVFISTNNTWCRRYRSIHSALWGLYPWQHTLSCKWLENILHTTTACTAAHTKQQWSQVSKQSRVNRLRSALWIVMTRGMRVTWVCQPECEGRSLITHACHTLSLHCKHRPHCTITSTLCLRFCTHVWNTDLCMVV